jgi:hypothetical protein
MTAGIVLYPSPPQAPASGSPDPDTAVDHARDLDVAQYRYKTMLYGWGSMDFRPYARTLEHLDVRGLQVTATVLQPG